MAPFLLLATLFCVTTPTVSGYKQTTHLRQSDNMSMTAEEHLESAFSDVTQFCQHDFEMLCELHMEPMDQSHLNWVAVFEVDEAPEQELFLGFGWSVSEDRRMREYQVAARDFQELDGLKRIKILNGFQVHFVATDMLHMCSQQSFLSYNPTCQAALLDLREAQLEVNRTHRMLPALPIIICGAIMAGLTMGAIATAFLRDDPTNDKNDNNDGGVVYEPTVASAPEEEGGFSVPLLSKKLTPSAMVVAMPIVGGGGHGDLVLAGESVNTVADCSAMHSR